ncbi:YfhH family protein [Fervidibacillus albus]|uniref:YfhH family protein n=1 Tax=Fervidibacillus albus TaxID=2980026 RepID=A0A9E8RUZ9_9BACI|nr:YfhH family protein [Fervidibacillus albus]WAA08789.1 YfhH family protein [Fervidibacillus albus]
MDKRYSEMTEYELKQEIAKLREKAKKAEQMGMVNEFAVLERKAAMAESYLLDPQSFVKGEIYRIKNEPNQFFKVDYLRGYFAWGFRLTGDKVEALPISLLEKVD